MPKMIVTAKMLSFSGKNCPAPMRFPKDSIIDCTDEEAAELVEDGNAEPAPEDAELTKGEPIPDLGEQTARRATR